MQYSIFKDVEFDAGHRVPNHNSKCRNPHGHRYKVRVGITGDLISTTGASDEGMVQDFGYLKSGMMKRIHDVLDHGFIIYNKDEIMLDAFAPSSCGELFKIIVVPFIPTAENLAVWCGKQMEPVVERMGCKLVGVTLWETPTSFAIVTGGEDADQ